MHADTFTGRLIGALARADEPGTKVTPRGGLRSDGMAGLLIAALARTELTYEPTAPVRRYALNKLVVSARDRLPVKVQIKLRAAEARYVAHEIKAINRSLNARIDRLLRRIRNASADNPIVKVVALGATLLEIMAINRRMPYVERKLNSLIPRATSTAEFFAEIENAQSGQTKASSKALLRARDSAFGLARLTRYLSSLIIEEKRLHSTFSLQVEDALSRLTPIAIRLALAVSHNDFSDSSLIGFDLRDFDLTRVKFADAIWSETTKWPVRLEEQMRRESREIGPGMFKVIGPPTTNVAAELVFL